MGLDANGTKFLFYAKRKGVSFARTAMIGRQSLSIDKIPFISLCSAFGINITPQDAQNVITGSGGYAELLFKLLGAEMVTSFDNSDYEQADVVVDLNMPIGSDHKQKYSAVMDGGTLEHVFNYPTALKNCMEMVEPGGHFLSITPANNFLGHGFYQFSPELFFSVFNRTNGFELEQAIIFEDAAQANWYRIRDPREMGRRVTLINSWPAYLLIIAKRTEVTEIFRTFPQQSDYEKLWYGNSEINVAVPREQGRLLRLPKTTVNSLRARISRWLNKVDRDKAAFESIDPLAD